LCVHPSKVQIFPIQVQGQAEAKVRINEVIKAGGSDCLVLVPDASRENYDASQCQPISTLEITGRIDDVKRDAQMLLTPFF